MHKLEPKKRVKNTMKYNPFSLTNICARKIVDVININPKNLCKLNELNPMTQIIVLNMLNERDFKQWKKNIYTSLVEIESKNWEIIYESSMFSIFTGRCFHDLIIYTTSRIKQNDYIEIKELIHPYWEVYYNKYKEIIREI